MKKILMRAGLSPLENLPPSEILLNNLIGNNVGNFLYAFSMFRALMLENTEVVPNHYKLDEKHADQMNEEYDCFVIPLADAFRTDFIHELQKMTTIVKKLKIPCIVTGVGLRAPYEPNFEQKFPFDHDVKEFIKAILDKSSIVGVRGEITGTYLSKLGFREEVDYTVIGCPSMYTFGGNLSVRETSLTKDSIVSINNSIMTTNNVQEFLEKSMSELSNHYFVPQRLDELRLLFAGMPYTHNKDLPLYPSTLAARLYAEDKVKFFLNVPTWLNFLREADLSFGSRLHGNIAAVLAGTPALFIPHDARMRELIEYHNLTNISFQDINSEMNIFEIFEKCEFKKVITGHNLRFEHFVDFLDKNNLEHIYKNEKYLTKAPLDLKLEELVLHPPIKSIVRCDINEMVERWNTYFPKLDKMLASAKEKNKKIKNRKLTPFQKIHNYIQQIVKNIIK